MSRPLRRCLALSLAIALLGLAEARAAQDRPEVPPQNVQDALKKAVVDAQEKLGPQEPWQKKIFAEEVIPQYMRFIQDYRPTSQGTQVEVNQKGLKDYLSFYAPKTLKRENPSVAVLLLAEPGCARCTAASPAIRQIVKSRLEARGFTPWWIGPDDVNDPLLMNQLMSKALEDRVIELAHAKSASAAFILQWRVTPVDSIDSAHADETHYQLKAVFETAMGVAPTSFNLKHERQVELLQNDPIDASAIRILTEAFTVIGEKTQAAVAQSEAGESLESWIQVSGIEDFFHFTSLKSQLQSLLGDAAAGGVEDRRLSRGKAVFALRTRQNPAALKSKLHDVAVQLSSGDRTIPRKLVVTEASDSLIQVEIR